MLVIAHRLRSVVDADRVCVMDAGRCAEFDTPHALLSAGFGGSGASGGDSNAGNAPSLFAALVRASGEEAELRQLAAVLLRRRIGDMWEALSEEQQANVQIRLGEALVADLEGDVGAGPTAGLPS